MKTLFQNLFEQQKTSLDYFFQKVDLDEVESVFQTLLSCRGLIVLTGVGKSGLIAQKIAATLVSTGTRALFLCPTNALHGDIGILGANDLLIAFSKSGQTEELIKLLPYVKKKGIPTISVVSSTCSKLEQGTDQTVHLPVLRELCPLNLAPTTSTAIQLLFGDILAMALMQQKRFETDDFALNHPAGLLGRKITTRVADLMFQGKNLPLCKPNDKLLHILHELSEKQCGCLLVVDDHFGLLGVFTDGDLRRAIQHKGTNVLESTIQELMTSKPHFITPSQLAFDALKKMEDHFITTLPVIENDQVIGLIRMHDIIQSRL